MRRAGIPLVQKGEAWIPPGHAAGLTTVIVDLRPPPLAAAGRTLAGRASERRLDVGGASSRAYLARLAAVQRRAVARLRRAIPQARVSYRFRLLLDGLTVTLPARRLPALVRLPFAARVYPSVAYRLSTNESPQMIGADALQRLTGADGAGIKIAIVDDGIDQQNPFFDPKGYSYPPGFPKGGLRWTTPKVIVARAFPGPGSGHAGRLALDPRSSFHGTHVAGIAAGDAGTSAPAGPDHPAVSGLSGVAPRAWLGNYRVFTVPTPIGHVAETPQIVAAFEAAVADGMDVINFSGGGAAVDPANDALIQVVRNVALAGVVPVIAAGNDRDDFGAGTVGSPGSAPDAITVGAVSSNHVFSPALTVVSPGLPGSPAQIPYQPGPNKTPPAWGSSDQTLVDVGSIAGTDGRPVDRLLCNRAAGDVNAPGSTLPAHSLDGAIALVSRGVCTFASKALRAKAAGAIGIVVADNRPGEANPLPLALAIPGGMVAGVDGARLRAAAAASGGRLRIRVGTAIRQISTDRGGVPTSFTGTGPTDFGHLLKPDIVAPGGQILSATLPAAGGPFAVFDGTSMATPHVAGAVADLLELHRDWTPGELKSALMSTAVPAHADAGSQTEAAVPLEGAGLVSLPAANGPLVFTSPSSLSFPDLDAARGGTTGARLVSVWDAGGGAGTWRVSVAPEAQSAGVSLEVPGALTIAPGGSAELPAVARATAGATPGDDYGFVVLTRGQVTRRIPYSFSVVRPALAAVNPLPLRASQRGDTRSGVSHASAYRYPSAPFGPAPDYVSPPVDETGAEQVYVTHVYGAVANVGVAVVSETSGSQIDPWLLGSLDENDVAGYAGTPVDVNSLSPEYRIAVGAAGASFPRQGTLYVAVDSGRDPFTGRSLAGAYTLRSWVNDVTPPSATLLTTRVPAGRPLLAARVLDSGSGVDPLSLELSYGGVRVGASSYDPATGIALFALPPAAPALAAGRTRATIVAADYQEAKNVDTTGPNPLPNTRFLRTRVTAVDGPALSWLAPAPGSCARGRVSLLLAAGSTAPLRSVSVLEHGRPIAAARLDPAGIYRASASLAPGTHALTAVALDRRGRRAEATLSLRVCKP